MAEENNTYHFNDTHNAISYSLLFYQQYIAEQNIKNSIFQEYRNNQIEVTEALSKHISSDQVGIIDPSKIHSLM